MKRTIKSLLLCEMLLFFGMLSLGVFTNMAYAGNCADDKELEKLLTGSGGHENIFSVRWAANTKSSSCESKKLNTNPNVCSLWIGPIGDSKSTRIKAPGLVEEYAVSVYGMCTSSNGDNEAKNIRALEDDGTFKNEISGLLKAQSIDRGGWGSPTSGPATLNIKKFAEIFAGSKTVEGNKVVYSGRFLVGRCHEHVGQTSAQLYYNDNDCNHDYVDLEVEIDPSYLAESNVSSGKTSASATTGIVNVYTQRSATPITVKKGESASIRFSHNVFANAIDTAESAQNKVGWVVSKEGNGWSLASGGGGSGEAQFSKDDRYKDYYIGGPRNYSSSGRTFILRDEINVTFPNIGTYEFCEVMTVDNKRLTKVCAKVTVGDEVNLSGTCESIKSMVNGQSEVFTRVFNQGNDERKLVGEYSDWKKLTYAMPTDVVAWIDCYLPGAQVYADNVVSYFKGWNGDGGEGGCYDTTNDEKTMTQAYQDFYGHEWTNKFKVSTSSPRGFNELDLNKWGPKLWPENGDWKSYTNGDSTVKQVDHNHEVRRLEDIKETFTDEILTPNTPNWSSWRNDGRGYHPWTICSESCCGRCCGSTCDDEDGGGCCYDGPPCCCDRRHTNLYNIGDAGTGSGESNDESSVTIPYNYINTTEYKVSSNFGGVVYAGETIEVSDTKAIVGERENGVVEATYTTKVDSAEVRLIGYVTTEDHKNDGEIIRKGDHDSNICAWLNQKQCNTEMTTGETTLNADGDLHGHTDYLSWASSSYNVFDASAGDYMCFVMAVYPATSGIAGAPGDDDDNKSQGDRNTKESGDGTWRVSAAQCIIIAKRPSAQIWGGDLYTSGSIGTSTSDKKHLYGLSGYDYPRSNPTDRSGLIINGSWVEEGIVASGDGTVRGLSSGASLGRVNNIRESGGLNAMSLCDTRAPLSIANHTSASVRDGICPYINAVGKSGIASTVKNRKALADYWDVDIPSGAGSGAIDNVTLGKDEGKEVPSASGKNIRVVESINNITINDSILGPNMLRVVKTSGDVRIAGDIKYNSGEITSSGQIPKAVIYGKNINIACDVGRIDAILIAEKNVTTCDNSNGINDSIRSNQLIINGIVISDSISLERTYGNWVGNGSGVPAEIINYDTSALLWGRYYAGSGESDTMTVTYQHEMAPRY